MADITACMSSKTDNWSTPQDFFNKLDDEFHFTLDPCADNENHKCNFYYTKEQDGLKQDWGGRLYFAILRMVEKLHIEIAYWVEYAYKQMSKPNTVVVMLIPARTDTKWFHEYIYNKAEIRFIKGRLKFGNAVSSAPTRVACVPASAYLGTSSKRVHKVLISGRLCPAGLQKKRRRRYCNEQTHNKRFISDAIITIEI